MSLPCHHMTGDQCPSPPHHPQLFEILAKTLYGHEKKGLFGIDQLLSQGVFKAAFPLHEVRPGGWRGCGGGSRTQAWAEFLEEGVLLSPIGSAVARQEACNVTRPCCCSRSWAARHCSLSTREAQQLHLCRGDSEVPCAPQIWVN